MQTAERIAAVLEESVEARSLAGAATLIWRNGGTQVTCAGWRDIEAALPMQRDTLFRIASLTKPITSVLALMLMDEGRFALDDPITPWAPELCQMRVLRTPFAELHETDAAHRQITFDDLLTHRSGLIYAVFHGGPIAKAYDDALGGDVDSHVTPDEWISRLANLPLIDQPGHLFHYGLSTDLLGLLIARMEGKPLADVLRQRIFEPLAMHDTGFTVPEEKSARCATLYGFDDCGRVAHLPARPTGAFLAERPETNAFASGGQGLWSTLDDYLAFARIFLGEGAAGGVRILRPETCGLMMSNRLTERQRAKSKAMRLPIFAAGHGFGLGVAVVMDSLNAAAMPCGGNVGSVGWPGAFGGWWRADPADNSVMIFLTHQMAEVNQLASGIGAGAYRAMYKFQSLASPACHPHSTEQAAERLRANCRAVGL
jgi:CubicO group peptidase (beta-lactamase class C family)